MKSVLLTVTLALLLSGLWGCSKPERMPGQLVIGAEVGGRQRGERRGIEVGRLTHGGDQLPAAVHEQRAARLGVVEEPLERHGDGPEIVLGERPGGGADGHGCRSFR